MEAEQVVLVDELNQPLALMGKLEAHKEGRLHRAVSCFLFSNDGLLLVQRRALDKYHSAGLWANTCCSHPRSGEAASECMARRLREELGIEAALIEFSTILYKCDVGNGLIENEFVHGFVGNFEGTLDINPQEVCEYMWVRLEDIFEKCEQHLAGWFRKYIEVGFLKKAFNARPLDK